MACKVGVGITPNDARRFATLELGEVEKAKLESHASWCPCCRRVLEKTWLVIEETGELDLGQAAETVDGLMDEFDQIDRLIQEGEIQEVRFILH